MPATELDALRDEIRALREEVRSLRESLAAQPQVHHHYAPLPGQPQPWQPNVTLYPPQTYTYMTPAPTAGCSGVPQTFIVNGPAQAKGIAEALNATARASAGTATPGSRA